CTASRAAAKKARLIERSDEGNLSRGNLSKTLLSPSLISQTAARLFRSSRAGGSWLLRRIQRSSQSVALSSNDVDVGIVQGDTDIELRDGDRRACPAAVGIVIQFVIPRIEPELLRRIRRPG